MKNTTKRFKFTFILLLSLAIVSCSKEVNIEPLPDDGSIINPGETADLKGSLDEDRTLDPNETYSLTGVFSVESGATLTIPAGTRIQASTSSEATKTYIRINKGGKIEIQGTSSAPVIMESQSGQPGSWGGLVIAGNAVSTAGTNAAAEVDQIPYGGTDSSDNSGSINYLVISDAGAQINSESQYNGLSLYAVGSGTTIQNVAIIDGADDGVEFFGGSASITNLYLENNQDDAVDWTEGWSGSVTNTYVLHTTTNFSTAVEADGQDNNPKLVNFTAVSTSGGTALQFKKLSGATISGLSLLGYTTSVDITEEGRTDLSNIQINGADANSDLTYTETATVDLSIFDWIDNRGTVKTLSGSITSDMTLNANTPYIINSVLSVESGATLTIPAGTSIVASTSSEATKTYIRINKGAKIDIQGTASKPVIMSSASGISGSWGGLVIAGDAVSAAGVNAAAEVDQIPYGGENPEDNSGSIKYLIIKDAGAQINPESQYNGLSLYAVGSATVIENIAMLNGADDGIEFFGGSVSVKNAYFENNEDDQIDWTEGWNGGLTNAYINLTTENFSTALEGDGPNGMPEFKNLTAVSTKGGTALQFKKQSGAVITGLSLSGFDTNIDITEEGRIDLSGIQIDGMDASIEAAYDAEATVDVNMFDWVN